MSPRIITPADKPLVEFTQPTAGALRAAKKIDLAFWPEWFATLPVGMQERYRPDLEHHERSRLRIAALIDAETGLPELVAALEIALNTMERIQVDLTMPDMKPAFDYARVALAKAQRTSP